MFKINWPLKATTPTTNDVTSDPFLNTLNILDILTELQYDRTHPKTSTSKFAYIFCLKRKSNDISLTLLGHVTSDVNIFLLLENLHYYFQQ